MSKVGRPGKSTGRRQSASNADVLKSSSNQELLAEIDQLLSGLDEEIDVDAVEVRLAILQERAPVMETYDPQDGWRQLQDEHPALFQGENVPREVLVPKGKKTFWVHRVAAVFAAILFCSVLTANALGYNPVHSFLKWIGDTVQVYSNPSGLMELPPDDPSEYHSMREALDANGREMVASPTWIPKDYALQKVTLRQNDEIDQWNAWYISERGRLVFRALAGGGGTWFGVAEKMPGEEEEYVHNDVTYYITSNYELVKAGWTQGTYSCEISGNITKDELKQIIHSIQ